jgi:hypothetical protein
MAVLRALKSLKIALLRKQSTTTNYLYLSRTSNSPDEKRFRYLQFMFVVSLFFI